MITNIIEKGRVSHACQNYFFVYFYHKMYHRDVKPNGALGQCWLGAHISACDIMEFKIWLLFVSCKSNILWWVIWIEIEIPFISSQHKCAMYWPSKQAKSEAHGPLRVTYLDEEAFAHYTLRRFEVKPVEHSTHYSQVCLKFTFLSRYEINMYD